MLQHRARLLLTCLLTLAGTTLAGGPPCGPADDLTPIAAVQGPGERSPAVGGEVRVEGVVTASFLRPGELGGVFVQAARGDDDDQTSEGLWVRVRRGAADDGAPLTAGAWVRVRGTVLERNGMTQLDRLTELRVCGRGPMPGPVPVTLPVSGPDAWEAIEGMLIRLDAATVTEVYDLGRYGRLELADARLFAPGQGGAGSGTPAGLRSIVLDDGSDEEDPRPLPYLMEDGLPPRVGDRVEGLTAIPINVGLGLFRLEPVLPPTLVRRNPRPPAPAPVDGRLRVASLNAHNFFTTLGRRGADSAADYALQRDKLVATLAGLDADLVALQEVENGDGRAVGALLDALNARLGAGTYAAVPDPASGTGDDAIKQVILYRPTHLELVGSASDPAAVHDRPPLAATFRERGTGAVFTLVDVHFKSKGGCPPSGDTDAGSGCWNLRRSAQAQAVVRFAQRLQAATQDPDLLVVGDLNSYLAEPPLQLFTRAGYHDLDRRVPAAERYSYVFYGASGTLDYALASPSLAPQVEGVTFWHVNADESPLLGALARSTPPELTAPDPYRSSDHDPLLLGLSLR